MEKSNYKELKEKVRIIDYARTIGFTPVRVGSYYTLKEHDSVRIDPRRNIYFRNSTGEHGTVIDFALAFTGKNMHEILTELEKEAGSGEQRQRNSAAFSEPEPKKEKAEIVLPPKGSNLRNVYAYLTKTRGIDRSVVDRMVSKNMLYQDARNNCVFVSYEDNKPVFACMRGTNTYKRFVADFSGSDYSKGFLIKNDSKILFVVESVIDALSVMTICTMQKSTMPDILALSGVSKDEAVYNRLSDGEYTKVYLALDNDKAGFNARMKIQQEIIKRKLLMPKDVLNMIPKHKDWNEDLLALLKERGEKQ